MEPRGTPKVRGAREVEAISYEYKKALLDKLDLINLEQCPCRAQIKLN